MEKKRQVLSFADKGQAYRVFRCDGKVNPYRIYHCYRANNQYGYLTEHRKMVAKYDDLASCFYWFLQNGVGY